MLKPIQNHALCRWIRLAPHYCLKVSSDTSMRLLIVFSTNALPHSFTDMLVKYMPLGFHVSSDFCAIHFATKDILPVITPSHSPWLCSKPDLGLSLNKHAKSHTRPEIFQRNFLAVCNELSVAIYTETDTEWILIREQVKNLWIPDKASIFLAELVALNLVQSGTQGIKNFHILRLSVLSPCYSEPATWIWICYEVPQKLYSTGEHWQSNSSLLGSWSHWY